MPKKGYDGIQYWTKKCKSNGIDYRGNINADTVAFNRIVKDRGYEFLIEMIDWYFEEYAPDSGDPYWFIYNYHDVEQDKLDRLEDRAKIRNLKEQTRERMKNL